MTDPNKKPAGITPSATVGPFFKYGLTPQGKYQWSDAFQPSTLTADAAGERIVITGRVIDGDGVGIPDAILEIWQADSAGRFAHPLQSGGANSSFQGFARADTGKDGGYRFETIKPGKTPGAEGRRLRRRTSWSPCLRAACCAISTRAFTSPTRQRRTQPTPC